MTYDLLRRRVVLFGGNDGDRRFDDTWEWDGIDWIERRPSTVPANLVSPAMAFDVARGRCVMIANHRTFEWDGTDWRKVVNAYVPVSSGTGLVYWPAWGAVVACLGHDGRTTRNDVWRFDGTGWQLVSVTGRRPEPRSRHATAYDASRERWSCLVAPAPCRLSTTPGSSTAARGNGRSPPRRRPRERCTP